MEELVGKTLGQYLIQEPIGQGGMAVVYRAYQPSLERYVAVKVLPPAFVAKDSGFAARFQREARSIANLSHPNILAVHDFGLDQGYSYIVMHFVEGGKTMRHLARGSSDQKRQFEILIQVAHALDYAHWRGIIHRDVKPGNVLMEEERPLLADFGLAKFSHEGGTQITGSNVAGIGTPAYMSPEQGYGREVDHHTDIYALGVMLYEVLTGTIPHAANTPLGIIAKRNNEPVPSPRQFNPNLPAGLEQVALRALRISPAERYASAAAFAEALQKAATDSAYVENTTTQEVTFLSPAQRLRTEPDPRPGVVTAPAEDEPALPAASPLRQPPKVWPRQPWLWVGGLLVAALLAGALLWGNLNLTASSAQPQLDSPTEISLAVILPTATLTSLPQPSNTPTLQPTPTLAPPTATPVPAPKIIKFRANPAAISAGQSLTLEWEVAGVDSVAVAPLGAGFPPAHRVTVAPLANTTYILTAFGGSIQLEPLSLDVLVAPSPTDTPFPPTFMPTPILPTVTPTSSPLTSPPTLLLAPSSTPVPPTATPNRPQGSFTLLAPLDLNQPSYGLTVFEWEWNEVIPPDDGFEIQVWREGEPPAGAHDAVLDNQQGHIQKIGENRYQLKIDITQAYGVQNRSGLYWWTVKLVQISPDYSDLGLQAEPAQLRFELPGGSGGGSSGGSSSPGGGIN